jgi:hypothetical protein
MAEMTWGEMLQEYLERERQVIHNCSADYHHTTARKGMEQEFEAALIKAEMLESALKKLDEARKPFMD